MSVKLQDLSAELKLSEEDFAQTLAAAGVKVPEGVKRLADKDASRVRVFVFEQRKRTAKKQELIALPSVLTVRELAERIALPVGEIITALLKNGLPVTVNEQIDYETAAIIASDLGYQTSEDVASTEASVLTPEKLWEILKKEDPARQQARPPVVTIMGHVDHGKTTLLDTLRKTNVAATEAGGITQSITGYQVRTKGKGITFVDTPGHEAFEFMRKRGASIGDIAILVVAADEGVKEQTKEAIRHALEAEIPIIVALTKIDKPEANLDRVKRQVTDAGLTLEEWGGTAPAVSVSAKTGKGLDVLLDTILVVNEVHPTRAIPDRPALASVVEAHRDPNTGPLATVLIHTGRLRVGDPLVCGNITGTARKLLDFTGHPLQTALAGTPVTILGLEGVPNAGDILQVVEERAAARAKVRQHVRSLPQALAPKSIKLSREERATRKTRAPEEERAESGPKLLPIVLKAESQGSLEALRHTLTAMNTPEVAVRLLRADVGGITDSDVRAAETADGIVLGFNVTIGLTAQKLADTAHVPVHTDNVIYRLTDEVRARLESLLPPEILRTDHGTLQVLKVFFSTRGRQIVGGRVQQGRAVKGVSVEVLRGTDHIATGTVAEVQENKVPVEEVRAGHECGITFAGEGKKIKEGDLMRFYTEEVKKRKLGEERSRAA